MPFEMITAVYIITILLIIVAGVAFLKYYSKTHQGEDDAKNAGKIKFCKNDFGDVVKPSELENKNKLTMKKTFYYLDPSPRRVTAFVDDGVTADGVKTRLVVDFMAFIPADFVEMAAKSVFGMNDEAIDELLEELASNAVAELLGKISSEKSEEEMKPELLKAINTAVYSFGYSAGKLDGLKLIR